MIGTLVLIIQVLQYHNVKIDKMKKIKCVAHNGTDYNMGITKRNKLYCPVCGTLMNVVDLYMGLSHCDFKTALHALDSIYNLGVFDMPNEQLKQQAEKYRLERERQLELEAAIQYNNRLILEYYWWLDEVQHNQISVKASIEVTYQQQLMEHFMNEDVTSLHLEERINELKTNIIKMA